MVELFAPEFAITTLALLNASEYLPNQIVHGGVCLTVFLALRVWTLFRPQLWGGYLRIAAYFHLSVALGILVFKLSSLPPLQTWELEPVAHMLEEFGPMGAYSWGAVYLSRAFINVVERPKLNRVLESAPYVFACCWLVAFSIALFNRFPMTGMHTELSPWSFPYRAAILGPGILYCGLFSFVFLERALLENINRLVAVRLTFFSLGSFVFFLICADQLAWAYVHAFASPATRDALAGPQIAVESTLYALMGGSWLTGLAVSYRRSNTQRSMESHKKYLRLRRYLAVELSKLPRRVPRYHTKLFYLNRAAELLYLEDKDLEKAQGILQLVYVMNLPYEQTGLRRQEVLLLDRLHDSLIHDLSEDVPQKELLREDQLPETFKPALSLTASNSKADLTGKPLWVQLPAAVAADNGVLPKDQTTGILESQLVSGSVLQAYKDAKTLALL